ncbi:general transcription factor IIH subunit 1-like [Montipora capricornis]|uniref:general transcription factor IIH subunit 1-like n=1 Tax=Montipora capricornis TaxID=246305 RepID=UPI0035F18B29
MADGETVLLEVINTKHKKNGGVLRLLSNTLVWIPHGSDNPKLSCAYSEIKVQRISPEGSSKIQIQLVLHDGNTFTFQFTSEPQAHAKKERDEAKDLLAQLIPAHRKKANKELEEKNRMLKDNPELYQLYKDLVVSSVITAEEFWANRGKDIQAVQADQAIGLSSALLADMQPESSGCNEVKYNLNVDTIEAIFKTYPAVKKKHQEVVPHEMPEKDFWTKFFQSHYFHRDRVSSRPTPGDMFTECAKEDEHEQLKRKLATFKDPLLDLTGASPVPDEGYGLAAELVDSKNNTSSQGLFRRLNHHSLMVLQTSAGRSSTSTENDRNEKNGLTKDCAPPAKKSRLREMVEYDDLSEEQVTDIPSLKIADSTKFSQGLIPAGTKDKGLLHSKRCQTDNSVALQCNQREVEQWKPDLPGALPSDMACHVLTEMSPGGSLMTTTSETNMQHLVSSSLQKELKLQYNSLSELLRHFWSCFPVKTQLLEEKMVRIGQSLEKYRDVKLQQFRSQLASENLHLASHLIEMLDSALSKYRTWLEKKSTSRITR